MAPQLCQACLEADFADGSDAGVNRVTVALDDGLLVLKRDGGSGDALDALKRISHAGHT